MIESGIDLDLRQLLISARAHALESIAAVQVRTKAAEAPFDPDAPVALPVTPSLMRVGDIDELTAFVLDRLRGYYADQGVPGVQFDAVADVHPTSLVDFDRRLKAIAGFAKLREAAALAAANKRIRNILRKVDGAIPDTVDVSRLVEPAEQALHGALVEALAATDPLLERRDYVGTLKRLAALQGPVDNFFARTMVMADDPALRDNRLALLRQVADRFATVAAVEQLSAT
jgi:glycyl-tRNA synthetase beta chain